MDFLVVYLFVNAILAGVVAYLAQQRGRSWAAFFALAFVFSFLVGILVLLAIPVETKKTLLSVDSNEVAYEEGIENIKCPYCAEWVKSEAKICKHCGKDIAQDSKRILAEKAATRSARILAEEQTREAERVAGIEAENQKRERYRQFRATPKFKLIVAASVVAGVSTISLIVWAAITTPKPLKTTSAVANEWLDTMKSCGFNVENTTTDNDDSQGPIYLPDVKSEDVWVLQIVEQEGIDGAALIIDKSTNNTMVNCFSEIEFDVTISEEEITNESDNSTSAIPAGYQRAYEVETKSYVFYTHLFDE